MKIVYSLIAMILLGSCTNRPDQITNKKDYTSYLADDTSDKLNATKKELAFWNHKIREDSIQLHALGAAAASYRSLFDRTGEIENIKLAEQCLKKAETIAAIGKNGYVLALAQNYITQHRFKEAKELLKPLGNNKKNKQLQWVLFDVNMELGAYNEAENNLANFKNFNDYNYLIRLAKFTDYKGDLDATIKYMEKAMAKAESSKSRSLMIWTYTNLADYYGHAGRIKDSYTNYLKALRLDPENAYAKKGIAWILFSYEHNAEGAMQILNAIAKQHQSPDYHLLKAEIANYLNDDQAKDEYINRYLKQLDKKDYGEMYNAHKILVFAEETGQYEKAIELARKEVGNRATPQTYALLAYSYLLKGDKEQSLSLIEQYVAGKTFEPHLQYQMARIYKQNGLTKKAEAMKQELKGSLYELGPGFKNKIEKL